MKSFLKPLFRPALLGATVLALALPRLPAAMDIEQAYPVIIEALKSSETLAQLTEKIAPLKEQGASDQQLAEVKLLFILFRTQSPDDYAAIAGDVKKLRANWKPEESLQTFATPRSLDAFEAYMNARAALDRGDEAAFEANAKTALFLGAGTEAAAKYGELVEEYFQLKTPLDMNTKVLTTDGTQKTLAEIATGQKAVYLQVWATWCAPCIATFPALKVRAEKLPPQGVAVVALNNDLRPGSAGAATDAKAAALRKQHELEGVTWYHETAESPFVMQMNVDSVPRAVVFTPAGKVLFNGHPLDEKLGKVLARLDVKLNVLDGLDPATMGAAATSTEAP